MPVERLVLRRASYIGELFFLVKDSLPYSDVGGIMIQMEIEQPKRYNGTQNTL